MAGQCPELHFDVVGDSRLGSDPAYRENLHARASLLPNVHLHGRVPHAEMAELYQGALALVCTSQTEGLPNTFVEAWCCGVPVVSTFDPDGVVSYRGLGFAAHDVWGLVRGAARLIDSPEVRRDISQRARRHYLENHSVQAVIPKFEKIFDDLAQEGCGSGK
jgi:glycosyltransferase involved in cell wall biosynthesis